MSIGRRTLDAIRRGKHPRDIELMRLEDWWEDISASAQLPRNEYPSGGEELFDHLVRECAKLFAPYPIFNFYDVIRVLEYVHQRLSKPREPSAEVMTEFRQSLRSRGRYPQLI